MRVNSPQIPPSHNAKSVGNHRSCRSKRSTLWKSVGRCLAGGLVFAVAGASWGATYTYTPTGSTTDTFSGGQNWTPSAPVSAASTELTFVGANATVLTAGTSTVTQDDGAFQLNILDLQGTGPASGATTINIASTATTNYLDFVSNSGTGPVINLNAFKGAGTGLTYNVYTPLQLDANLTIQGNGNTGVFNFLGVVSGAGNITKNGTGNATLYGGSTTGSFTGSVDVEGGTLTVSSGTINGVAVQGQLYTDGTLNVGKSGTVLTTNGSSYYAVGALTGTGTVEGDNTRYYAINYNGASADTFTGTFGVGSRTASLVKDGLGTLDLTGASFVNIGSVLQENAGTFKAVSLANFVLLNVNGGTTALTPTSSGTIFNGSTANYSALNARGTLSIVPNEPGNGGTALALTALNGAGVNQQFRMAGGALALDLGNASSVSLAIGNTGTAFTGATSGSAVLSVSANGGLIIAPDASATAGQGINALGSSVKIAVVQSGVTTGTNDATVVNNGMVEAQVIGQNNDTNKSGTFLTYVATAGPTGARAATDQGFTPVTFDDTNFATTTTGATKELVNTTVSATTTLTGPTSVYALRDDAATINEGGNTLSIGSNSTTFTAGLIMNGGSITGGTVAFGTSVGEIYVSGANATISSAVTNTNTGTAQAPAGNGITIQGPGVLALNGSLANLFGNVNVLGATLETPNAGGTGSAVAAANIAGNLNLGNGVYQSFSTSGNPVAFIRGLGNNAGLVNFAGIFNAYQSSGGGFAARGGPLNVAIGGTQTNGVASGGTVLIWGTTTNFITDAGTMYLGSPTADNTVTLVNPLSLGATSQNYDRVVNVALGTGTDLAVLSGVITTGAGATATANGTGGQLNALAKTGAGTLELTANNLYTGGTVVNQGTLLINNTPVSGVGSGTGTGAVTVTGAMGQTVGGALGGTGQIAGAVTVAGPTVVGGVTTASGGTITGGPLGSVGTLTLVSNATINGTYQADILAGASDRLAIGGTLTIGTGATLAFTGGGTATANSYDLANYTSETGTFTTVTGVPSGYTLQYNTTELDLVSGAVPEPSTWVGGLVLMGMLGYSQRRRFGAKATA